jgi:RNA polymerase sigma factor (sigma-70 family)
MTENESDSSLLRRLRNGDDTVVETLYARYAGRFYRYAAKKGLRHDDADDIVQKTFIRIVAGISTYKEELSGGAGWMWRIFFNQLVNHTREFSGAISLDGLEETLLDERQDPANEETDPAWCFPTPFSQAVTVAWASLSPAEQRQLRPPERGPLPRSWYVAASNFRAAIVEMLREISPEDYALLLRSQRRESEQRTWLRAITDTWEKLTPGEQETLRQGREFAAAPTRRVWQQAFERFWLSLLQAFF